MKAAPAKPPNGNSGGAVWSLILCAWECGHLQHIAQGNAAIYVPFQILYANLRAHLYVWILHLITFDASNSRVLIFHQ